MGELVDLFFGAFDYLFGELRKLLFDVGSSDENGGFVIGSEDVRGE
jgi:hypothetical protein